MDEAVTADDRERINDCGHGWSLLCCSVGGDGLGACNRRGELSGLERSGTIVAPADRPHTVIAHDDVCGHDQRRERFWELMPVREANAPCRRKWLAGTCFPNSLGLQSFRRVRRRGFPKFACKNWEETDFSGPALTFCSGIWALACNRSDQNDGKNVRLRQPKSLMAADESNARSFSIRSPMTGVTCG